MTDTLTQRRYWRMDCPNTDATSPLVVSIITEGDHKPESLDVHSMLMDCPVCGQQHTLTEETQAEHESRSTGDFEKLPPQATQMIEEAVADGATVLDIIQTVFNEEAMDGGTVAWDCRWCDKEHKLGAVVFLWGEPLGGYVALHTLCSEDCVKQDIDAWAAQNKVESVVLRWRA